MSAARVGDATIVYEERGDGFPILLLAPGGMGSTIAFWERAAIDPLRHELGPYRLVAMDQRNAGGSEGPLERADPWGSFTRDQLGLMSLLGHERFAVFGCCVGCSYALRLARDAPERVVAGVLQQPIGLTATNAGRYHDAWREWGDRLLERRPELAAEEVEAFGRAMWGGEFVGSVSRDDVRRLAQPLLVLPGVDEFHPTEVGREVAALAPRGDVLEPWKDSPELVARAIVRVREWLADALIGEASPQS